MNDTKSNVQDKDTGNANAAPDAFEPAGDPSQNSAAGDPPRENVPAPADGTPQKEPGDGVRDSHQDIAMIRAGANDAALHFIARAGANLNYYQAEILRRACVGLSTRPECMALLHTLTMARRSVDSRPPLALDHPFQNDLLYFIADQLGHLSFFDAEIIRIAGRSFTPQTLDEVEFLVRHLLHIEEAEGQGETKPPIAS